MQKSWYKIFNYGTIAFAVIAAVLLILDKIPMSLYMPLLVFMIVIFILRILIRGYLINKSKTQI
jgi:hypothetical protein